MTPFSFIIKPRAYFFNKTPSLNENYLHRLKVIDRKREIARIKMDVENGAWFKEPEPLPKKFGLMPKKKSLTLVKRLSIILP